MIITFYGDNYFKFQSGNTTILLDPTNQRSFKGANLVLNTMRPSVVQSPSDGNVFWVDHAGEYEVSGIRVFGWTVPTTGSANPKGKESSPKDREQTVYRMDFDGLRLVFLGPIKKEPSPEIQEHLSNIDIVIVPAGGKPFIREEEAAKYIRQLEPAIIIPSLFKTPNPLLKELNQEDCKPAEKLVIKKKDIKAGAMEVVCLKGN